MDHKQKYLQWVTNAKDEQIARQLRTMSENEIKEAFSGDLSFGTAGLRGIMSAGTARMNVYTVYRATEGLAMYMDAHGYTSCAITYDSRNNSKRFSEIASATLARHGITVYITAECMPTPFLSFMVRELKCDVGINVTASHNPAEYNGYKVYDRDGCQLLDEDADEVTSYIERVELFEKPLPCFDDYVNKSVRYTDKLLEEMYIDRVLGERLTDESLEQLNAVYTPLNGAGYRIVPETLRRAGMTVLLVEEQALPNGDFPTCPYPNPEKAEALALAEKLATEAGADIVFANDPDCDRLGVAVRDGDSFRQLTGNEVGILLTDTILRVLKDNGDMPDRPVIVKTIVTTPMVDAICNAYGAEVRDVLTGFKYIGNVIGKLEKQGAVNRYVFGFEESCGYLKGSYVRDKDGVVASLLIAETATLLKKEGKTLISRLDELYDAYGHYLQRTLSYRFEGLSGAEDKEKLLSAFRFSPFDTLGTSKVVDICDFLTQSKYDLPVADVLRLRSDDGSQLIVRPSGTEPLIKCYITVKGDEQGNERRLEAIKAQTDAYFSKREH